MKLGTPNACNDCHTDKSAEWAAAAVESWHGPNRKGFQNYAEAFHAAWTDQPDAAALLAAVASDHDAPAFARASALTELALACFSGEHRLWRRAGLADPDPMVRIGALDMLESCACSQIWPLVSPLLSDASRGVRIRAARCLPLFPTASQPPADRERFERAADEFVAAQRFNADRPEARCRARKLLCTRGLAAEAEAEYKAALRLEPAICARGDQSCRSLPADSDGTAKAKACCVQRSLPHPRDAGLHHALGLTLTRLKRPDEALDELRRAAELDPEQSADMPMSMRSRCILPAMLRRR